MFGKKNESIGITVKNDLNSTLWNVVLLGYDELLMFFKVQMLYKTYLVIKWMFHHV